MKPKKNSGSGRSNSITVRLMIAALLWCVAIVSIGVLGLTVLYNYYQKELYYKELISYLDELLRVHFLIPELSERADYSKEITGRLEREEFETVYSGWYWQIRGSAGTLITSRSLFDCELEDVQILCPDVEDVFQKENPQTIGRGTTDSLVGYEIYKTYDSYNGDLRIIMSDVVPHPILKEGFRYSITGDFQGLENVVEGFVIFIGVAFMALVFGTVIAVYFGIKYSLRPLEIIRKALSEVRKGRSDTIEGNFPSEVEPLVLEVDQLFRARNLVQVENLAHKLVTPLTVMMNESVAGEGPLAVLVDHQSRKMKRAVDHYLERARRPRTKGVVSPRVPVQPVLETVLGSRREVPLAENINFAIRCKPGATFLGDREDLEEMVEELLDNAIKWSKSRIRILAERRGKNVVISVEDDGVGIPKERQEEVLSRGVRLDPAKPGSGLGLSNVREKAEYEGGSVILKSSDLGGLRAVLTLPAIDE